MSQPHHQTISQPEVSLNTADRAPDHHSALPGATSAHGVSGQSSHQDGGETTRQTNRWTSRVVEHSAQSAENDGISPTFGGDCCPYLAADSPTAQPRPGPAGGDAPTASFSSPDAAAVATASPAPPRRLTRRQLAEVAQQLAERDWQLLELLAAHRLATTRQLARLDNQTHASAAARLRQANRHLNRLRLCGLVERLPRRIGGVRRGSAGMVWYLRPAGWRLSNPAARPRRINQPSPLFVLHTLAITETRALIHEAMRAIGGWLSWVRTEPACWRSWTLVSGARRWLKPDLEAVTTTAQGDEDHWLLEIDLGSEHPARLLATCHDYQDHLDSGIEQAATGGYYPQVVWAMDDAGRAHQLRQAIADDPGLNTALFRVVTVEELAGLIQQGAGQA